jgi:hypothetical protein
MSTTTSRRRAILAGAALPVLSLPASAASTAIAHTGLEPDPIFAAIEKARSLSAAFIARCRYEDDLTESGQELIAAPDDMRTPEMVSIVDASVAARGELANTVPATLAGLVAYLDYVVSESEKLEEFFFDGGAEAQDFVGSLARCAKQLAREAVQS